MSLFTAMKSGPDEESNGEVLMYCLRGMEARKEKRGAYDVSHNCVDKVAHLILSLMMNSRFRVSHSAAGIDSGVFKFM